MQTRAELKKSDTPLQSNRATGASEERQRPGERCPF